LHQGLLAFEVKAATRQPAKVTPFAGGNAPAVRKKRLGDFFPIN
jgi:hypothetical protein